MCINKALEDCLKSVDDPRTEKIESVVAIDGK